MQIIITIDEAGRAVVEPRGESDVRGSTTSGSPTTEAEEIDVGSVPAEFAARTGTASVTSASTAVSSPHTSVSSAPGARTTEPVLGPSDVPSAVDIGPAPELVDDASAPRKQVTTSSRDLGLD